MLRKVKILFIAANPRNTSHLNLDEEIRAIAEKIQASEYRDMLELVSIWATRPDDLLQALNIHKPHIVHFSGHGNSSGELIFVDNDGQPKPVSPRVIEALFTTLKDNIKIVLLNACYSRLQAKAIIKVIDCVVGLGAGIGDTAAIIFAASFYRTIGFGRSVQDAFDQGKLALLLEGTSEEETPELLCREGMEPSQIFPIVKDTTYGFVDREPITLDMLTRREREILSLIVQSKSTAEIAQSLNVSHSTMRHLLHNVYRKLGVQSRVDATRVAIDNNLL